MYAAILNNMVIDIQEDYMNYPPTISGDEVITLECPDDVKIGDEYDAVTEEFIIAPIGPFTSLSGDSEETTDKDTEEKV